MTSDHIFKLLQTRHSGDLVIGECKTGPTMSARPGELQILDAWVLVRTWSPITAVGYEIKVSRSDWVRDQKMAGYLGACHLFYVVAPKGIVNLDELPAEVGLLEASEKRLLTRKKAPRRDVTLPVSLLAYVLMNRVEPKLYGYAEFTPARKADYWREWLTQKHDTRDLGSLVTGKIRERYRAMANDVAAATKKAQEYEGIRQRIIELGFNPDHYVSKWDIDSRLRELGGAAPENILGTINATLRDLQQLKSNLESVGVKAIA